MYCTSSHLQRSGWRRALRIRHSVTKHWCGGLTDCGSWSTGCRRPQSRWSFKASWLARAPAVSTLLNISCILCTLLRILSDSGFGTRSAGQGLVVFLTANHRVVNGEKHKTYTFCICKIFGTYTFISSRLRIRRPVLSHAFYIRAKALVFASVHLKGWT
jgi:hypothetical protein